MASAGPYANLHICISLQTNNHAGTPPLSFLLAGCPSCHPTNSVKALNASNHFYFLVFLFYTFQLLVPCGRLSWFMSAFERTLKHHLVSYRNSPYLDTAVTATWPGFSAQPPHHECSWWAAGSPALLMLTSLSHPPAPRLASVSPSRHFLATAAEHMLNKLPQCR